jgi:hypothetical protein
MENSNVLTQEDVLKNIEEIKREISILRQAIDICRSEEE